MITSVITEMRAALSALEPVRRGIQRLREFSPNPSDRSVLDRTLAYVESRESTLRNTIVMLEQLLANGYPGFDITQGDPEFLSQIDRMVSDVNQARDRMYGLNFGAVKGSLAVSEQRKRT